MNLNKKILQLRSLLKSVDAEVDTKASSEDVDEAIADIDLSTKQDVLLSGTNIKTINSTSLLGSGNIAVGGGSFSGDMDDIPDGTTYVKTENNLTDDLASAIGSALQEETDPVFTAWDKDYGDLINKPTIPVASDVAYDADAWDGNTDVPTKNVVRDKFESLSSGGLTQPQIMARTLGC